jgi:hypothetical protein
MHRAPEDIVHGLFWRHILCEVMVQPSRKISKKIGFAPGQVIF